MTGKTGSPVSWGTRVSPPGTQDWGWLHMARRMRMEYWAEGRMSRDKRRWWTKMPTATSARCHRRLLVDIWVIFTVLTRMPCQVFPPVEGPVLCSLRHSTAHCSWGEGAPDNSIVTRLPLRVSWSLLPTGFPWLSQLLLQGVGGQTLATQVLAG